MRATGPIGPTQRAKSRQRGPVQTLARNPYTEKEITDSIQVMDVLSDGNLLCGIAESKRDRENGDMIPIGRVADTEDPGGEPERFEDLARGEQSRIVKEAAGYLFSRTDVDRAIKVVDDLLAQSDPAKRKVKGPSYFDARKWREIRGHVDSIKSSLRGGASGTAES